MTNVANSPKKGFAKDPIAIVGMACRFPKAANLNAFWSLLSEGLDGIDKLPANRWNGEHFYNSDPKAPGKTHSLSAGYIENIDRFDAAYFGISPREAVQMDPQQRLLLEVAQEALDDAGLPSSNLTGSNTGVYIGAMSNDYLFHQLDDDYHQIDVHTGGGAGHSMLANRLSYYFDWHGPSVALDTACSSSLVAVLQACQTLWLGNSDLALAGGVNLMLDPAFNIFYSKAGLLAPDGRCKTFSAEANGIGRGEGVGLIVLKRLSEAVRDGDRIYACIQDGAVNHGGRSNGVTAPNRWAQEQLMDQVFQRSGIDINDLGYVELHGTGTYIGDPIEAKALSAALLKSGRKQPVLVGSVKTNIGHLEGAAGIAGLIKLALTLHHRTVVPNLHFAAPSPAIDFEQLPLQINTKLQPWPVAPTGVCSGAVSSFGLGGTNAHLILQSPHTKETEASDGALQWLSLSATSESGLRELATRWQTWLAETPSLPKASLATASLTRRNQYPVRLQIFADDRASIINALNNFLTNAEGPSYWTGKCQVHRGPLRIAFHPSIWVGPLAGTLANLPLARDAWLECQNLLAPKGYTLPLLSEALDISAEPLLKITAFYSLVYQLRALLPEKINLQWQLPRWSQPLIAAVTNQSDLADSLIQACTMLVTDADSDQLTHAESVESLSFWLGSATEISDHTGITLWSEISGASDPSLSLRPGLAQLSRHFHLNYRAWLAAPVADLPAYPWQHQVYWLPRVFGYQRDTGSLKVAEPTPSAPVSELAFERSHKGILASALQFLSAALRVDPEQVDLNQPLTTLGIDSLTAVEVKNRLERQWGVTVPLVKFLDGFSLNDVAAFVLEAPASTPVVPTNAVPLKHSASEPRAPQEDEFDHQVAAMSDVQVAEMLRWYEHQEAA